MARTYAATTEKKHATTSAMPVPEEWQRTPERAKTLLTHNVSFSMRVAEDVCFPPHSFSRIQDTFLEHLDSMLPLRTEKEAKHSRTPKPPVSHGDFRRFFYRATTKSILKARKGITKGGNELLLPIEA